MHRTLLALHSWFRWVVLLAGALAVAKMATGWVKSLAWTRSERRASLLFTVTLDIQLLLGVGVYIVSPLVRKAIADVGTAMTRPEVRFFLAEHPSVMLVAVLVAHAGSIWARRAPADDAKFRRGTFSFSVSLALVLWAIPWFRLGSAQSP